MTLLLTALAVWILGALAALVLSRRRAGIAVGVAAAVAGGALAAAAALGALGMAGADAATWSRAWALPYGALALRLDALGAVFLLPVGVVGAACAVYGAGYLRAHGTATGAALACLDLLLASMALVTVASDFVLLLVAWEGMTLTSFLLVMTDHERDEVRAAGLEYLVAAHVATAALLLLVFALAAPTGSTAMHAATPGAAALPMWVLLLLALVGFGTKAGLVPLHVWLPDAHPAAPGHVSALMSAVMITMGFYGLARVVPLLGAPPLWWGILLMALGAASALGGIAFALAQTDVKRLLAYSTIENAGLVALAMGAGWVAASLGAPVLAGLAWTAALLHLWNHALYKALLFQGMGAVALAAHDRSLDALGGVLRRWRLVGALVLLGTAAIIAMPGLNGFTSEWTLLRALLGGALDTTGGVQGAMLAAVVAVALTGALAVACFARLAGVGLLGTARSARIGEASSPGPVMWAPMALLAALCVAIALDPVRAAAAVARAVVIAAPGASVVLVGDALRPIGALLPALLAAIAIPLAVRALALRRRAVRRATTWGCGFPEPTPAMQYGASSFAEPLTRMLAPVLRSRESAAPSGASAGSLPWEPPRAFATRTPDLVLTAVYAPAARAVRALARRLHGLREPHVQRYVLYVVLAVLLLLLLLLMPLGTVA